jgi:hypothetical protein
MRADIDQQATDQESLNGRVTASAVDGIASLVHEDESVVRRVSVTVGGLVIPKVAASTYDFSKRQSTSGMGDEVDSSKKSGVPEAFRGRSVVRRAVWAASEVEAGAIVYNATSAARDIASEVVAPGYGLSSFAIPYADELESTVWSPREWIISRGTGKRAFFDLHIPKTAGSSLSVDIKQVLPAGEGYWSKERCLLHASPKDPAKGDIDIAYFRDPMSHVYSQFLECKYDEDWKRKTPGIFENVTAWLMHFSAGAEFDNDFRCYHPYNMQTRALTCKSEDAHHYSSMVPVDVDMALSNLKSLGFIGIVEHYQASLCLFHAKAHDMKEPLPRFCDCKNASAWNSFRSKNERHGVPSHSVDDLSQENKGRIKALTQKDELVYREALKMFSREIVTVEDHFGVKLLC